MSNMRYVVVIETDDGKKDYKVFEKSGDAVGRYDAARARMARQEPVRIGGEEANILSCQIFRAKTDNIREAKMMVESGNAEPFKPAAFYRPTDGPKLEDL